MGLVVETLGIQVIIARNIIIHSLCIRFVISMLGTSSDWTTLMLVVLLLRFPKKSISSVFHTSPFQKIQCYTCSFLSVPHLVVIGLKKEEKKRVSFVSKS